jgi:plastocyanin
MTTLSLSLGKLDPKKNHILGAKGRKLVHMSTKSLTVIATFAAVICIYSQPAVKAGGPLTSTSSTTGRASIKGVVTLEGKAPKPTPINMAADPSCAKQHPTAVLNQEVVTDAKGGLQNVVVFITDGLSGQTFEPPSQPVVLDQKGCIYQPHVLAIQANQPIEVVNDDPTSHNIHPVPANNREWNKSQPPGSKAEETFQREEIAIPVKCNIHPWMRGYVAVFKHPYFVVTGKDGSFDLPNLPPGTYTVKAWHEKLGSSTQKITVGTDETKAIDFVFKSQAGT